MARGNPLVLVATILLLAVATVAPSRAADEDRDKEKMSNDRPDRPLQMPPASSEAKEAFDDFERFARRGAWERAFKALYAIPDDQASRFVDGADGFIVTVGRKRRSTLAGLSPEGLAAYRLFYDDEAKKLLDRSEGPGEQAALERIASAYFLTGVGDDAADRLGDLYYEQGDFDRAADCWLGVLRDRPDTDLAPATLAVKAALALTRAGRRSEAGAIARDLAERYSAEVVTVGGRTAKAPEFFQDAKGWGVPDGQPSAADGPQAGARPELVEPSWTMRFGASILAGMTPAELTQWDSNPLSLAVPGVAIDGSSLFVNYLGNVFALDRASGKMLWRSSSFHNVDVAAMQQQVRMVDPTRYAIVAAPGYVWTLSRDLRDPNFQAPFVLTCRKAEGGDVVWKSTDLPGFAEVDLVGRPILARETLFVVAKTGMMQQQRQDQPEQFVLAIRPLDGKLLWKTQVGTFRQGRQMYFYYGMPDTSPHPRLASRGGSVYVDTDSGVLARLDAESGRIDWGYGYETEPTQTGGRFFFVGMMSNQEAASAPSTPLGSGEALLIKGSRSGQLCALDPDRMKVLWTRPIAKSARLLGVDDRSVYLGGPELGALDLKTRSLRWSTRVPGGSERASAIVRPDGIWQLTPRGVFEVDPDSGRVRRILRVDDPGSSGGDLFLADRSVLAISNRTIAAYPRGAAVADRADAGDSGAAVNQSRGVE